MSTRQEHADFLERQQRTKLKIQWAELWEDIWKEKDQRLDHAWISRAVGHPRAGPQNQSNHDDSGRGYAQAQHGSHL